MPKDNKIKSSVTQRLRPSKSLCYNKSPNESQQRSLCDHTIAGDYYLHRHRCRRTGQHRRTSCFHKHGQTNSLFAHQFSLQLCLRSSPSVCGGISSLDRMLLFSWRRSPTKRRRFGILPRVISETTSCRRHPPNESVCSSSASR